jgi:cytoplasmic iron level regulating protein YaaA (DUF328/UPF0246 family)
MLVVISPAKRLDETPKDVADTTMPMFQADANRLATTAKNLPLKDLRRLMDISVDLAKLNSARFKAFEPASTDTNAKAAAFYFAGDTYLGLEATTISEDGMRYAQSHLRILSGLYGLLRPLDLIQAYRLEMGSRLKTRRGKSLYAYWGDRLSKTLNVVASDTGSDTLLNCASKEYFGAVDPSCLKPIIVTPVFLEVKNGQSKTVSFFAKRARGAMARFVVENQIRDVDDLKGFDAGGYQFQPEEGQSDQLVFSRDYRDPIA